MLAHRVRIKCSNAFYEVKSIVCNNDRAARICSCTSPHTDSAELSGELVGYVDTIYLSVSVQTWNYTRALAVRRKCARHLAVPFFLAMYIEINCGCAPSLLSERNVVFRRTSVETRTLADWKIRRCGITWEILWRYRTWTTVMRLPITFL